MSTRASAGGAKSAARRSDVWSSAAGSGRLHESVGGRRLAALFSGKQRAWLYLRPAVPPGCPTQTRPARSWDVSARIRTHHPKAVQRSTSAAGSAAATFATAASFHSTQLSSVLRALTAQSFTGEGLRSGSCAPTASTPNAPPTPSIGLLRRGGKTLLHAAQPCTCAPGRQASSSSLAQLNNLAHHPTAQQSSSCHAA